MSVKFEDYSIQCKGAISDAMVNYLEESAGEIQSQTERNCKVVSGDTKGSFGHIVDKSEMTAYIGSNYENAIWEEFGTGIYAVNGDGRKTPWIWTDEKGEKHVTQGKQPKRMLFNAFNSLRGALHRRAEDILKELK